MAEQLAPRIAIHLENRGGKLVSLFGGSLAVERAVADLRPDHEQLAADAVPELLWFFDDLQQLGAGAVHQALLEFDANTPRTKEGYEAARELVLLDRPMRSARFIWLSSMCLNGIWRVNQRGIFNQSRDPARLASKTALPPIESFIRFAQQVRHTRFVNGFVTAWMEADLRDLLFIDPPYVGKGAFREYTKEGFDDGAQRYLASLLRAHAGGGGALIAFNSPAAAHLYEDWGRVEPSLRKGTVNTDASARGDVEEIIITANFAALERAA